MFLIAAALAAHPLVATAVANPVFSATEKHGWATFPATVSGKPATLTLSCKAAGCDVVLGQQTLGTASFKIGDEVEATLVFTPSWSIEDAGLRDIRSIRWTPTTTQVKSLRAIVR